MELELSVDSEVSHVKLPATMSIADAGALKTQLQRVIDARPTRVVIDLDAVVTADTATLQLLTSFVVTATRNGGRVQWDNLSVPLYMAACQLNLEEHLQF
jgi:anti-anti-sigma regulatory factor